VQSDEKVKMLLFLLTFKRINKQEHGVLKVSDSNSDTELY